MAFVAPRCGARIKMDRHRRKAFYLASCLIALSLARGARADGPPISALIDQLAAADPAVRAQAGDALLQAGSAARDALLGAAKSPSPSVAEGAAEVLLQMPWSSPADSPEARKMLADYGRQPPAARAMILARLVAEGGDDGAHTAVRVAAEDPSPAVAWGFVFSVGSDPAARKEIEARNGAGTIAPFRFVQLLPQLTGGVQYPLDGKLVGEIHDMLSSMRDVGIFSGPVPGSLSGVLLTDALWRNDMPEALTILRRLSMPPSADIPSA